MLAPRRVGGNVAGKGVRWLFALRSGWTAALLPGGPPERAVLHTGQDAHRQGALLGRLRPLLTVLSHAKRALPKAPSGAQPAGL